MGVARRAGKSVEIRGASENGRRRQACTDVSVHVHGTIRRLPIVEMSSTPWGHVIIFGGLCSLSPHAADNDGRPSGGWGCHSNTKRSGCKRIPVADSLLRRRGQHSASQPKDGYCPSACGADAFCTKAPGHDVVRRRSWEPWLISPAGARVARARACRLGFSLLSNVCCMGVDHWTGLLGRDPGADCCLWKPPWWWRTCQIVGGQRGFAPLPNGLVAQAQGLRRRNSLGQPCS